MVFPVPQTFRMLSILVLVFSSRLQLSLKGNSRFQLDMPSLSFGLLEHIIGKFGDLKAVLGLSLKCFGQTFLFIALFLHSNV